MALRHADDAMTYGELQQATMMMCTWLRAQGVKRGESVALQLPFLFRIDYRTIGDPLFGASYAAGW